MDFYSFEEGHRHGYIIRCSYLYHRCKIDYPLIFADFHLSVVLIPIPHLLFSVV